MATRLVEPLDVTNPDNIPSWFERLECAIDVQIVEHKIDEDKQEKMKVSYLLSNIGSEGYRVVRSYCAPDLPTTKTFADLKKVVSDNLAPTPQPLTQGYAFSSMKQEPGETVSMYMARLKERATYCDFGGLYDRMVKDRFIFGLRNEKIRASLLNKSDLDTSAKVLTEVIKRESMQDANQTMSVHSVKNYKKPSFQFQSKKSKQSSTHKSGSFGQSSHSKSGLTCSRCTLRGHTAKECRTECNHCRKVGHIKANCYALNKSFQRKSTHNVDIENVTSNSQLQYSTIEEDDPQYMFHVGVLPSHNALNSYEKSLGSAGVQVCTSNSYDKSSSPVSGVCTSSPVMAAPSDTINAPVMCASNNASEVSDTNNVSFVCNPVKCVSGVRLLTGNVVNDEVNSIDIKVERKLIIPVSLNGKTVHFEFDSGSAITCMNRVNFNQLGLVGHKLETCDKTLCVANGQILHVKTVAMVSVKYKGVSYGDLGLHIVDASFPTLFGRDWISVMFGSDWFKRVVNNVSLSEGNERTESFIKEMKMSPIFRPEIGDVQGYEARLNLKPDVRPRFCKARVTAFAIKEKVCDELKKMIADGRLIKVDHSDWASAVVPVVKPDGSIRVCGDYKSTLNPALDTKVYPLPTVDECFAEMVGGQLFTKIDIKQAYNSLRLRQQDQILTTLNTALGLLKWGRLPYGINSAGAQFQATIDEVLSGISHVCCRVDDILITGRDDEKHMANVREVVSRLEKAGFRCRLDKSQFMQKSVVYLGHVVSAEGIRTVQSKVETLVKAPYPENREKLIAFLGAVQYYSRYLPDMATVIEPLNHLRSAKVEWVFGKEQKEAYDKLKCMLTSDRVLTFYNPSLPLKVDCDASATGLGGVISHILPNGEEKPIEFVSRTLSPTERRYAQIDREALSIVWSLKKFHKYVYARPFHLTTDHKPLQYIFHPHKGIPEMIVSRLQRWALMLGCYDYTIQYRPTSKHSNADVCSRFPLPNCEDSNELMDSEILHVSDSVPESVFAVYIGEGKPLLNCTLIAKLSRTDAIVSKVIHYVMEGWPQRLGDPSDKLTPFHGRQGELSVDSGCLMWGSRVVIPEKMRTDVLQLLHSTHMGSSSMKNMARRYLWWPGLDADIESVSKRCSSCTMSQPLPRSSAPHPWNPAEHPWDRIHIDFAGPYCGSMWLVVVCAYSKWIEVVNMGSNTTAPSLIRKLREIFSRFGLCRSLVSDNGPQLSRSHEFTSFLKNNGIRYIPIPSYHPSSNGQAEVMVGKFKQAMKKMCSTGQDINHKLANWLFQYRNTPHSTTGFEPSVLMFGRRHRTSLSLLNPLSNNVQKDRVLDQQAKVIETEKRPRSFKPGDTVLYRDVYHDKWINGVIKSLEGAKVCIITSGDNVVRKHLDHVVSVIKPAPDKEHCTEKVVSEELREAGVDLCNPRETVSLEHDHNHRQNLTNLDTSTPGPSASLRESLGRRDSKISNRAQSEPKTVNTPVPAILERPRREIKVPDRLAYTRSGGPNQHNKPST